MVACPSCDSYTRTSVQHLVNSETANFKKYEAASSANVKFICECKIDASKHLRSCSMRA